MKNNQIEKGYPSLKTERSLNAKEREVILIGFRQIYFKDVQSSNRIVHPPIDRFSYIS